MAPRPPNRTRFRTRLVVSILIATIPLTGLATFALTRRAARDQGAAGDAFLLTRARHVAADFAAFVNERQANMSVLASTASSALPTTDLTPMLGFTLGAEHAFAQLETTDLLGTPMWWTRATKAIPLPSTSDWFRQAASGQASQSGVFADPAGALHWLFLQPIVGADGRPIGIVSGDVKVSSLAPILDHADFAKSGEILIADAQERMILTSKAGLITDDVAAQRGGTLVTSVASLATSRALAGQQGTIHDRDHLGARTFAAYTPLPEAHWGLVVTESQTDAFTATRHETRLAKALLILEALALTVLASSIAAIEHRRLRELMAAVLDAGRHLDENAAEVATATEELAAKTSHQSDGLTRTLATMEEMARSCASVAATIDRVAPEVCETQASLAQAATAIEHSGERTASVAERLDDMGALAARINELADQANLLALNAAIEAARAGDDGRGFTVIADEVRRLAERSKASGVDIARIIEIARAEANVAVMSIEKGAEQMRAAHDVMEPVAQATHQVQLTTQQLRSAAQQLVETVDGLAEAGRNETVTAQQIAAQAVTLAQLATELQATAALTDRSF